VGLGGCTRIDSGFLEPAGKIAGAQQELFSWIVGLSLIVVLPVLVLTPWLLWRYRYGQQNSAYQPKWEYSRPMEIISWGGPVLIVILLGVLTWERTHSLDPYRPLGNDAATLEVQVIAMDWKWLFIYPKQGVATLNQLLIPVGRPIHLSLTSATVMQSLLIPQLTGQMYAMAGMRTQQYLQASRVGDFVGRNTQFNGSGFQEQAFVTRAVSPEEFDRWLDATQQSAHPLDCNEYQALSRFPALHQVQAYRTVQTGLFKSVIHVSHASKGIDCNAVSRRLGHE
jgi:cytochrome o ubiquinol oxidase subunit 2